MIIASLYGNYKIYSFLDKNKTKILRLIWLIVHPGIMRILFYYITLPQPKSGSTLFLPDLETT